MFDFDLSKSSQSAKFAEYRDTNKIISLGNLGTIDNVNLAMLNELAFNKYPYSGRAFNYLVTWQQDHSHFHKVLPMVGGMKKVLAKYGVEIKKKVCDSKWNQKKRQEYPSVKVDMCADGLFIPSICREGGKPTGAASQEIARHRNCREIYATSPSQYEGELESIIEHLGLPLVIVVTMASRVGSFLLS
eukprot:GHVR01118073.1.p1 GENE.GHVR01118073.1~~GHVR01118073.1.p1  ORF type:complete len:188 (-),score=19.96 GHVR01118073.1:94-657(-)